MFLYDDKSFDTPDSLFNSEMQTFLKSLLGPK